jgi:hypothetical protein
MDAAMLLDNSMTKSLTVFIETMGIVVGTLVVAALVVTYRSNRFQRERRERELALRRIQQTHREGRRKVVELGVGELTLAGWRAHREVASHNPDTAASNLAAFYVAIEDEQADTDNARGLA